jgi:hypothetical protein
MKTTTLPLSNSMNRSPVRLPFLHIPLVLALSCFALALHAQAVCQDACLTNDNTVQGDDALISLTTGAQNTAVGFNALHNVTTGNQNTALGYSALLNNTVGGNSTAVSAYSLLNNTSSDNTAYGAFSLQNNTTGNQNTAIGESALSQNVIGNFNTAVGVDALHNNFSDQNTAVGWSALASNMPGLQNTATGAEALRNNVGGLHNLASGFQALLDNTSGSNNTATGYQAMWNNTTGKNNTADGSSALFNNSTGSFNIGIGNNAGFNLTTGINNIDIGNPGVAGESKVIRIGKQGTQTNTYIAGISGVTVAGGVGVIVDTSGHLGTVVSSERYKDAIKPMDKASEAILELKPVTFRYKKDLDPDGIPQFGLVAEEVQKVNPDLVARDEQGKPYTVRYEAVNAMLLNEFLKEHRTVQEQQKEIDALKAELKEQRSLIHKVSAQLETNKPLPQTIAGNH